MMQSDDVIPQSGWDEADSRLFVDYGRYFVPDREEQLQTIAGLVPRSDRPAVIVELCCGEGLLAELLLEQDPAVIVTGFDGSAEMLLRAGERLARFGTRFQPRPFDLFDAAWRQIEEPVQAVVTSLALHHLDGPQKQGLFGDVYRMLAAGGVFIIADIIEPTHPQGWQAAAQAWDEAVRERALALDGTLDGFEFFERERWNTYRYFDPEDIDKPSPLFDQLKWLEQVGFSAVDVFWMRAGHAIFGGWRL